MNDQLEVILSRLLDLEHDNDELLKPVRELRAEAEQRRHGERSIARYWSRG